MIGLILMAGKGERFQEYSLPKPLIPVEGRPMFIHAAESLQQFSPEIELWFCLTKEHEGKYQISRTIHENFPHSKVHLLEYFTSGAAESAFLTLEANLKHELKNLPIFVMDCDFRFKSQTFKESSIQNADLGLLTFNSNSPNYSYLLLDENSNCVGCVEKKVVSSIAVAGLYYFANFHVFFRLYGQSKPKKTEFFMSSLINQGIALGYNFEWLQVDSLDTFGTPNDLERFDNE